MKGSWNNKPVNLPDFIISGAAKGGTTSMYRILEQHESVFVPPYNKETYFFSFFNRELPYEKDFLDYAIKNPVEYFSLFKGKENLLLGEASIGYLYDYEFCIQNIKKFYGEEYRKVKIIMILRNPVDRAFSHFNFLIRNGIESLSFEEAIKKEVIQERKTIRPGFDYLEYGMYAKQVKAFLDNFDNVKVFLFEELRDFSKLSNDLFQFLEIEPKALNQAIKANPSGIPKSKFIVSLLRKNRLLSIIYRMFPLRTQDRLKNTRDKVLAKFLKRTKMNEDTRRDLVEYFREDIDKLERLLEKDLSGWK